MVPEKIMAKQLTVPNCHPSNLLYGKKKCSSGCCSDASRSGFEIASSVVPQIFCLRILVRFSVKHMDFFLTELMMGYDASDSCHWSELHICDSILYTCYDNNYLESPVIGFIVSTLLSKVVVIKIFPTLYRYTPCKLRLWLLLL